MNFPSKLKALRSRRGLKQSDLAASAALAVNKIQRYEQSGQKPKGDDALALAKALGVTADYLLDDSLPFPPPEEYLSEKVAIIHKLEGLIGALCAQFRVQSPKSKEPDTAPEPSVPDTLDFELETLDLLRLPVFRLGAGYDVQFDAAGQPAGQPVRQIYLNALGPGRFFAAELHGSSMQGPGDSGFSLGEILVFKAVPPGEIVSGDYAYVRTRDQGLFRQVFVQGGRLRLRALNPADPEIVVELPQIEQLSRLVRRIRDY